MTIRLSIVLCTILSFGATAVQSQPQPSKAAARAAQKAEVPGEPVYYYGPGKKVELTLALDELSVEGDVEIVRSSLRTTPGTEGTTVSRSAGNSASVRLPATANRAALEAKAKALKSSPGVTKVKAVLYGRTAQERNAGNRQLVTDTIVVKVKPGQDIDAIAARHGLELKEKVSYSPDTYLLRVPGDGLLTPLDKANAIYETEGVEYSMPQLGRVMEPRASVNDTLFPQQWHLKNTGSNVAGGVAGNDINVESAWDLANGSGVNIAITDDGLQTAHPDLSDNARTDLDIDINFGDLDPSPSGTSHHGTACAGVAAATGNNSLGVAGVAYAAGLVGVRLIALEPTDAQIAQAMTHRITDTTAADVVSVSSNSWGPTDNGSTLETFGPLTAAALETAVTTGRGGLGTIFVWASGNGLGSSDNVNYDGFASSRYTIATAATGPSGIQSWFSEPGASILINTPSQGTSGGPGLYTTDRTGSVGYSSGDYYSLFNGTSAACPEAAGVVALLLQVNPLLTWRDVQHILVDTAIKNHSADAGWIVNGAGKNYSHKYGFGRINAGAAVLAAQSWENVPANAEPLTSASATVIPIPDDNPVGISQSFSIAAPEGFQVEHVEVDLNITHTWRGDLVIKLISPSGTTSLLANQRFDGNDNYPDLADPNPTWKFTTVANWGENPTGTWTLQIADLEAPDPGQLNQWALTVYGFLPAPTAVKEWMLYQ